MSNLVKCKAGHIASSDTGIKYCPKCKNPSKRTSECCRTTRAFGKAAIYVHKKGYKKLK